MRRRRVPRPRQPKQAIPYSVWSDVINKMVDHDINKINIITSEITELSKQHTVDIGLGVSFVNYLLITLNNHNEEYEFDTELTELLTHLSVSKCFHLTSVGLDMCTKNLSTFKILEIYANSRGLNAVDIDILLKKFHIEYVKNFFIEYEFELTESHKHYIVKNVPDLVIKIPEEERLNLSFQYNSVELFKLVCDEPNSETLEKACCYHAINIMKYILNKKIMPTRKCFEGIIQKIGGQLLDFNDMLDILVKFGYKLTYDDVMFATRYRYEIRNIDYYGIKFDEKFIELCYELNFFPYQNQTNIIPKTKKCLLTLIKYGSKLEKIQELAKHITPDIECLEESYNRKEMGIANYLMYNYNLKPNVKCLENACSVYQNETTIHELLTKYHLVPTLSSIFKLIKTLPQYHALNMLVNAYKKNENKTSDNVNNKETKMPTKNVSKIVNKKNILSDESSSDSEHESNDDSNEESSEESEKESSGESSSESSGDSSDKKSNKESSSDSDSSSDSESSDSVLEKPKKVIVKKTINHAKLKPIPENHDYRTKFEIKNNNTKILFNIKQPISFLDIRRELFKYIYKHKLLSDGKIKLDANLINKTNLMKLGFKIREAIELKNLDDLVYTILN